MVLLLLTAIFTAFAIAIEVVNFVAPDLLAGLNRESALKEGIARGQAELAESEKRIQALRTSLRNAQIEINRAANGIEKLDAEFQSKRKVDPVLVYAIRTSSQATHAYRASLGKTLPDEPEESQALMWSGKVFVEVEATSESEARAVAHRQFPFQHGYVVGEFQQHRALATASAA